MGEELDKNSAEESQKFEDFKANLRLIIVKRFERFKKRHIDMSRKPDIKILEWAQQIIDGFFEIDPESANLLYQSNFGKIDHLEMLSDPVPGQAVYHLESENGAKRRMRISFSMIEKKKQD